MKTAKRIANIPPYLFARLDEKKAALISKGIDLIDLGIGDPDQPTPPYIIKEMDRALADPQNYNYPPYDGTDQFREAVANWYKKRFGVGLDPVKEVVALIGSKEGIAHIFIGFIDPGDIALIPDPAYPVYKTMTILTGGEPYLVPLTAGRNFLPDLAAIPDKIASRAKLLFLNYPNNPTGAVATLDLFKEAVAFAKKYDLLICHDLAYSEVAFDGFVPPSILEVPGAKDVAVEFHSLSKTFNMTGWRIGMAVGNAGALQALRVIKTNIDSGVFKAIQQAGAFALTQSTDFTQKMNEVYQKRRDALVDGLNSLGWKLARPKATFYVWIPVPKGETSESFASKMLEDVNIIVVPGNGYGQYGEGYVRAAITATEDRIKEAIRRMREKSLEFA